MRIAGRLLALAVAAALAVLGGVAGRRALLSASDGASPGIAPARDAPARVATGLGPRPGPGNQIGYVLADGRTLTFPFPGKPRLLRLVSEARLRETPSDPAEQWAYAFDVEVGDRRGRPLRRWSQHLRAGLSESETAVAGTPRGAAGVPRTTLQVTGIDLRRIPKAASVRLRLAEVDRALQAMVVRLYFEEEIPRGDVPAARRRLDEVQRLMLSSASVFARPSLLTQEEWEEGLRRRWRPLAPSGVPGRDFDQRLVPVDEPGAPPVTPPAGAWADAAHDVAIAVPPQGGMLSLRLSAGETRPARNGDGLSTVATMVRLAPNGMETAREDVTWASGGVLRVERAVEDGWVVVKSSRPAFAQASLKRRGRAVDLTPVPQAETMYALGHDRLRYRLHASEEPVPLRLDLRALGPPPRTEQPVSYRLLDRDGRVLTAGRLEVPWIPSRLDALATDPTGVVGEVTMQHVVAPRGAAFLEIAGTEDRVHVAVFDRPDGLLRSVPLPSAAEPGHDRLERTWFVLRPLGWRDLVARGRAQVLSVPARPPHPPEEVVTGKYVFEDVTPAGSWRAGTLLVPAPASFAPRDEALASTFREIPVGKRTTVELRGSPPMPGEVNASVLLLRGTSAPERLLVKVDGQLLANRVLTGRAASVRLPTLGAGPHTFDVAAGAGAQVLVSHVPGSGRAFTERFVSELGQRGLVFDLQKTIVAPDVAMLAVWSPPGAGRLRLRVDIEAPVHRGAGPFVRYTIRHSQYSVIAPDEANAREVGTTGVSLAQAASVPIALGDDIAPGRVSVRVTPVRGAHMHVGLSRVLRVEEQLLSVRRVPYATQDDGRERVVF